MNDKKLREVAHDSKFIQMVKARNLFAIILSIIVLLVYATFMVVASVNPQFLASYMGNSHVTIGIPVAALVIIICWLVTGYYIRVTNNKFDKQKKALMQEYSL